MSNKSYRCFAFGVGDVAGLMTTDSTSPRRDLWRFAKTANIAIQTMIISIKIAAVFGRRAGSDFPVGLSGRFTPQYPSEHRDGKRANAL
jgi:hypothetical protein